MKITKSNLFSRLESLLKYRNFLFIFLLLLLTYFSLGYYQINNTGLTYDETAHLGAAQGYLQGYGLNPEHPLFLKLTNSLVLFLQAPQFRSYTTEQYSRGKEILLSENSYNFYNLLFWSRWIYLLVNSIFLLFIIYYTCFKMWLPPVFAITSTILFTFSPSFFSHNFLLTTDTGASIFAILTILSWVWILTNHTQISSKQFTIQTIVSSVLMSLALNIKFSNIILLPILFVMVGTIFIYNYRFRLLKQNQKWLKFISIHIGVFLSLTWLFYTVAFRAVDNVIGPSTASDSWIPKALSGAHQLVHLHPIITIIFEPFYYYFHGLLMVLNRTQDVSQVFYYDSFYTLNFNQFIYQIFWFKENPALFGFWLLISGWLVIVILKNKSVFPNWKIKPNWSKLGPIILVISFPLIYWIVSKDSQLTIGFRHFYPILLSIYLLTAWLLNYLLTRSKKIYFKLIYILIVGIYIVSGLTGSPQGLSYVNTFWMEPKWRLTSESSINWCQEIEAPLRFLSERGELHKVNDNILFTSRGCVFGFVEYTRIVLGTEVNLQSYEASIINKPEDLNFRSLNKKFLIVDSATFQNLQQASKSGNQQAKVNLEFLETRQPIFQSNEIIFIYTTT